MVLAILAQIAPRIIIPSFFVGQKVKTLSEPAEIAQTIAFSTLFVAAVFAFFNPPYWIGFIPGVAAVAYWMMQRDTQNQQTYRYLDWAITTPLMLLAILIAANSPAHLIVPIIVADLLMIGAGYLGVSTEDTNKKIAYFTTGLLAFVPIIYLLLTLKRNKMVIYLTIAIWSLYPIIYFLEDFKHTSESNATVAFSIMDMVSKIGLVNFLHF
jgi:bacteriorhodopsin